MKIKINSYILGILFFVILLLIIFEGKINSLGKTIETHMQFLDLVVMQAHPFKSILFNHVQPPLLDIIVWISSLLPGHIANNFLVFNAFCTSITAVIVYKIINGYFKSNIVGLIFSTIYVLLPSTILYTTYPFYPVPTSLGYALLVYSFYLSKSDSIKSTIYFALSISYLCLLRSSFALAHAIFFTLIYYFYNKNIFKAKSCKFLIGSMFVIVLAIPIKNFVLYDFFGYSSWAPLSIIKALNLYNDYGPYPSPEVIKKAYPEMKCSKSYGIQDTEDFKTNGYINFNSCYLIEYGKLRKHEILERYTLTNHIQRSYTHALTYLGPPDKYLFLENRSSIGAYADTINGLFMTIPQGPFGIRLLIIPIILFSIFLYIKNNDKFIGIIIIVIFVHFFTHVLLDGAESNRYVFDIEFIFLILISYIISCLTIDKKYS